MEKYLYRDILQYVVNIYLDHTNIQIYRDIFEFDFLLKSYIKTQFNKHKDYTEIITSIDDKVVRIERYLLNEIIIQDEVKTDGPFIISEVKTYGDEFIKKIYDKKFKNGKADGLKYKFAFKTDWITNYEDGKFINEIAVVNDKIVCEIIYSKDMKYKIYKNYYTSCMILSIQKGKIVQNSATIFPGEEYIITSDAKIVKGFRRMFYKKEMEMKL